MAEAEFRNMIMNFRVSDLVVLLAFAGRNKTGKKQELQSRALDLLKLKSPAVELKIRELHNRRYHHQLVARPSNYELPERVHTDRPPLHYDPHVNNNYNPRYNPNVRPTPINQNPNPSYSAGKPYIPPPPLSSSNALPHYASYTDVKFKELPFYDVLYEIQKPSNLLPSLNDRYQETTFYFTLSAQQANDIAISRNANGNYECQLLLRFCLSETSCEQDDNFPPSICVKVNGKLVPLPNPIPTNRPGVEPKRPSKPVNITPHSKLAPGITNMINISWSATYGRSYVAAIYVARQLSSSSLLHRLKSAGIRNPDLTTAMIKEKLQQGQDCEIATTSLQGSLICPLGKVKMELPCRAVTCTHIQCFDASLYIQMNEKKPKWICPVCDKPALFRTLALDGLFIDIVSQVPSDCTEVQFHEDGSWTPVIPKKEPKETPKVAVESTSKKKSAPVEVVDLSDNESNDGWSYNLGQANGVSETVSPSTPPLVYLPSDELALSSNSYAPSSSNHPSPYHETINAVSNIPNDITDPLCILPDIVSSHPDSSMPSTSSTSPGLGVSQYPHLPFLDSAYNSTITNSFHEQMGLTENQSLNSYNNFDLFSLLSIPEGDSEKSKDYDGKGTLTSPDVISLD